ncbi:MAG: hypothetical protein ACR2MA_02545 [Egibacteraceae bacterium]
MTNEQLRIHLKPDPELEPDEVEAHARRLREELLDLDVETVGFATGGPVPKGSKAIDLVQWGTLIVSLAKAGGVIPKVVDTVRAWLDRNDGYSATLQIGDAKLQLEGVGQEERAELIRVWAEAVLETS